MFEVCPERPDGNGKMVATIPKLIPVAHPRGSCPNSRRARITGHRLCRFPDCLGNPCKDCWCEETQIGFKCLCADGYIGRKPDIHDCSSNPCGDHGACHDEINSYTCECNDGWTGTHCETDINECSSNPCGDHGVCHDQINGYTCKCNDGWTGTHCETAICPSGWFYHAQKCYFRESERMPWTAAKEYCGKKRVTLSGGIGMRQASLLLVENREETDVIANEFLPKNESKPRVWINCNDELEEGRWVCKSDASGTVLPYRNWFPGQPAGTGDYAVMRNNKDGEINGARWYDCYKRYCETPALVVCQVRL
ncbi:protein jagged-1a-like [Lytechinus variegatus]|uniref:protein jagged-1a-like n=1 Tax=Lytechinus variegatus TaxID=7654 RepID=UPI001BB2B5F6|nr:protein jagged-1a-like [Lytechinus variegatus]